MGPTFGIKIFVWDAISSAKFGTLEKFRQTVPGRISSQRTFSKCLLGTPVMTISEVANASDREMSTSAGLALLNSNGPLISKEYTLAPSLESITANGLPMTSLRLNMVTVLPMSGCSSWGSQIPVSASILMMANGVQGNKAFFNGSPGTARRSLVYSL